MSSATGSRVDGADDRTKPIDSIRVVDPVVDEEMGGEGGSEEGEEQFIIKSSMGDKHPTNFDGMEKGGQHQSHGEDRRSPTFTGSSCEAKGSGKPASSEEGLIKRILSSLTLPSRNFREKLKNASRNGFVALLATGVSMKYPWSSNLTWFSLTLCISGVGSNLGQTLLSILQSWQGVILAVPVCLLLGLVSFSKVLTGILVFLTTIWIVSLDWLSEPAKKLASIFVVWDVLIPVANHKISISILLAELVKAVLGANIFCIIGMFFPIPKTAIRVFLAKLRLLCYVTHELLEDTIQTFCLIDDDQLHDLEELVERATAILDELKALVPHVKIELALWGCRETTIRTKALIALLETYETQIHNLSGMVLATQDVFPNATQAQFIKAMEGPLVELVAACKKSSSEVAEVVNCLLMSRSIPTCTNQTSLDERLDLVLRNLIKVRMRVLYGIELERDQLGNAKYFRSQSAVGASKTYFEETPKTGYLNLLPRNAFVMDLVLYCEGFSRLDSICEDIRQSRGEKWIGVNLLKPKMPTRIFSWPKWEKWRQPVKVGVAVGITSIYVLNPGAARALGPQTIWGPIAVCQTMSTFPSSSFKSGANRIQGTVVGALFGLAITGWYTVRDSVLKTVYLAVWVFLCSLNRGSATYGEAAVSAALTAPIIVVGPVVGINGLLVRVIQILLGTMAYVVVDNLFFPVRAKLKLRNEIVDSVSAFLTVWKDGLAVFTADPAATTESPEKVPTASTGVLASRQMTQLWHKPFHKYAYNKIVAVEENDDTPDLIRAQREISTLNQRLQKEDKLIGLAVDEPELWHKPFQRSAYSKVLGRQRVVQRYLGMLFRSSLAFPRKLSFEDQEMMTQLRAIVERLESVTELALNQALSKLRLLNRPDNYSHDHRVHLFQLRLELTEIEHSVDECVHEFFIEHQDTPVLTGWEFIVPLNGMLYSTRRIGPELVKFIHALRELVDRERPRTKVH